MTNKQATLDYLRRHRTVTSYEAFVQLGVTRLSAVIFNLKKEGHKISKRKVDGVNRYGKTVYFAEYTLLEEKNEQV